MLSFLKKLQKKKEKDMPTTALAFSEEMISLASFDQHQQLSCSVSIANDAHALETLKKVIEEKGLTQRPCICVLNPNDYQSFLVEKPEVPAADIVNALRWRLADMIDYPLMSAQLDFIEVPHRHDAHQMIYVIAANKASLEHVQRFVTQAGLNAVKMIIPELAIGSILLNKAGDHKTKVLVFFEASSIHLVIYKNDLLLLMRRFNDSLSQQPENFNTFAEHVALEVQRSLDYCSTHMMDTSNAMIYLSGHIRARELSHQMETILGLPVYPFQADHLPGLNTRADLIPISYTAIGGALGGSQL